VASANVTAWGLAAVTYKPIGSPLPSVTTITWLPLPTLVNPTPEPLFSRDKTAVEKSACPFQLAGLV
jgi:hypothetical protein